jgi:ABC-2 type transport system permease protein
MIVIRRFVVAAWLSYRALFTWLNPWGYLSTRIGAPILLTLVFGALGDAGPVGAQRPVIGGALRAACVAALYGLSLAVGNEREVGTLELRVLAPEGFLTSLAGKAFPHMVDGLLTATLTLTVGAIAFGVAIPPRAIGGLIIVGLIAVISCSGAGLFVAAIALRTRDTFTPAGILELLVTLLSGVFVEPTRLPFSIGWISEALPLRHAVEAALRVLNDAGVDWILLGRELAVGACWGIAGLGLFQWMLYSARRRSTLTLL